MKVGIIDADLLDNGTRHPNLALMKISGYHKSQGDTVELIESYDEELKIYDKLYMSKVFSFTKVPEEVLKLENLEIGGTGFYFDDAPDLPYEIEHHMPDYDLYSPYVKKQIEMGCPRTKYADYLDYSIGFATRGCFRKCEFCVNKKYDRAFRHSSISEFYDPTRPFIYLWDDNILAYSGWSEVLDELEETGRPFQFRQGIDLRLMTPEKAKRFTTSKYQGDFIFAFDHLSDREIIIDKVQIWKRFSSKVCKMYVLSGFESQDEKNIADVFERISILMKYGSVPYIMRHENYKNSKYKAMYIELARWCNQPQFFKKKSFREFCIANQQYKKNKETNCSAYQAMLDFEKEWPEIAKKYFDLKFEEENIYKTQYGYGRRYANKPNCERCRHKWDDICEGKLENKEVLKLYYSKEIDLQCFSYRNCLCKKNARAVAEKLIRILLETPLQSVYEIICNLEDGEEVTADNIPQFSDVVRAINGVPSILSKLGKPITYEELGKALIVEEKNIVAAKKYGENHGKLAALLDLAVVSKDSSSAFVSKSIMGEAFDSLSQEEKESLIPYLCCRVPIVQKLLRSEKSETAIIDSMGTLAESTKKRRLSNVKELLSIALNE